MGTQSGLNVIRVAGKEFLVTMGGGEAVHLTREAREEEERVAAAPDHYLDDLDVAFGSVGCCRRWFSTPR